METLGGSGQAFRDHQQSAPQPFQDQLERGPGAGGRPSLAVRVPHLCLRAPVSRGPRLTAQNPGECSLSKVNRCLTTRAGQLGWGRGGQPGSRKQFS